MSNSSLLKPWAPSGNGPDRPRATIIDLLLVILWIIVLPLDFPLAAPIRYPVAALVIIVAVIHYRDVLPLLKRSLIFFLLPGLALLSVLWADFPTYALRFSLLMSVGLMIALYTAARLNHRQLVICVFIAMSLLCLASFAYMQKAYVGGLDGGWAVIGVFPHKNVLGGRMVLLLIAAYSILFDKDYAPFWRLAAMAMQFPAWYLIFACNSATALLLALGVTVMLATLGGVWRNASRVKGLRPVLVAIALMGMGLGSLYLVNVERINPYTEVLEKLGKDQNLTGRTDIWEVGNRVIKERPILGRGAGSFWRPGVSKATQISTQFQAENNQFYFHNAYYEVTVHLGVVGLALFIFTFFKAYYWLIRDWLRHQNNRDPFFMALGSVLLLRTMTESELFSVFLANPVIFWTGVFLALKVQTSQRDIPNGALT